MTMMTKLHAERVALKEEVARLKRFKEWWEKLHQITCERVETCEICRAIDAGENYIPS